MPLLKTHRPTQKLGTFVATLFLVLFSGAITISPATADPDEKLKNLRKALTASVDRQEEISARLQLLSSEIRSLKEKSVRIARKLVSIDGKMIETEDRLKDIQQIEKETLTSLSLQNKGLANTLSALLQLSRQPEGSLIGSPENLINNLRAATLLKAAIPALKKEADQLSGQVETLAGLKDQFLSEQQTFQDLRSSRKSEQAALTALLASKKTTQSALSGLNKKEARRQKTLTGNARDMVSLIDKLEEAKKERLQTERRRITLEIKRLEKVRSAEILRKKIEERKRSESAAVRESATAPIPTPKPARKSGLGDAPSKKPVKTPRLASLSSRNSFISAKGTLPLPVGGKIISNYSRAKKIGQRNGIVIETRDNAAVVSPFDGQIAFAGPFRHYGLLLIIDHGEGYHTLLAGMGSIEGIVGQLLLAGEPVGQMRSSKNIKPTLYMELRVKGSPVNPIPWLAAENRKVSG
ncbi:MAG: peptidoglycan DD-metalloendopeptidase family protein [Sneathiella sp.]